MPARYPTADCTPADHPRPAAAGARPTRWRPRPLLHHLPQLAERCRHPGRLDGTDQIADRRGRPPVHGRAGLRRAAPYADVRPGRSCAWYAYWDHSPLTEARAELRHGIFAGAFPTHSAQVLAFVQLPVTAWRPGHGEQDLRAGLERCPSVAAGLDNAELSGRVVGVRDLPTYFRRSAGTGWALVGDAAHHKDPLAARGISDALLGAELLADQVLRGWDNDLDEALHLYAAELTRMLQPTAYLNEELARLDLPAEQARRTWQALQATERQIYPATSLAAQSS